MMRVLPLILALLVALTSQSFAMARGQTMAAGQIVLCSGGQAVTVSVDASGKPVGPAHFCPDMVLALMAGVATMPPIFGPAAEARRSDRLRVILSLTVGGVLTPLARGPPGLT